MICQKCNTRFRGGKFYREREVFRRCPCGHTFAQPKAQRGDSMRVEALTLEVERLRGTIAYICDGLQSSILPDGSDAATDIAFLRRLQREVFHD